MNGREIMVASGLIVFTASVALYTIGALSDMESQHGLLVAITILVASIAVRDL